MLDEIAAHTRATGYLVGDRFTVADLTAAALIAPLTRPPVADMQRPEPMPPALNALLETYAAHPAIAWVTHCYATHRGS